MSNTDKLSSKIFQHWTHSYEEDVGDIKVFRSETFDFPLSRGRRSFEMKKDGKFIQHKFGPTDAPEKVDGNWKSPLPNEIDISFDDESHSDSFTIVSCNDEELRIKSKSQ